MENSNNETNELESMRAALAKANEEAKNFRLERNELKTQVDSLAEQLGAMETQKAELESTMNARSIESKLEAANLPKSFAKYMSLDDVDAQIDELKQQVSFNEDASDKPEAKKPKTSADKLFESLQ